MITIQLLLDETGEKFCIEIDHPEIRVILGMESVLFDKLMRSLINSRTARDRSILIDGKALKNGIRRGGVCFIQKHQMVVDHFTAVENIFLRNSIGFLYPREEAEKTCESLFQKFGFFIPMNRNAEDMTSSQRRFLELYRVYLAQPQLLIMNEGAATLSYEETAAMARLLRCMKEQGTTVICFSTRWEDAIKISDNISIIRHKQIWQTLTRDEVIRDPSKLQELVYGVRWHWSHDAAKEMDVQARWMNAIIESTQIEARSQHIESIIRAYCERIARELSVDCCMIYIFDPQSGVSLYARGSGLLPGYGELREKAAAHVVNSAEPFFATSEDAGYAELFTDGKGPTSLVALPLRIEDGNSLLVEIGRNGYWTITKAEMDRLRFTSSELKIFLENIRLKDQTIYLKEGSHRFKNNMQVVMNLLLLQQQTLSQYLTASSDRMFAAETMDNLMERISTLTNVHNIISSEEPLGCTLDFRYVLRELMKVYKEQIEVSYCAEKLDFPKKILLPLTMMVNELLSNTVKHNTTARRKLQAELSFTTEGEEGLFCYRDNGVGFPNGEPPTRIGVGGRLIRLIAENDLKGSLIVSGKGGFCMRITFPTSVLR